METPDRVRDLTTAFLNTHQERALSELSGRVGPLLTTHRALFDLARAQVREPSYPGVIPDVHRELTRVDSRPDVQSILSGQLELWSILHRMIREVEGPHRALDVSHAALALVGDTLDGFIGALIECSLQPEALSSLAPPPDWWILVELGKTYREFHTLNRITRDLLDTREPAQMFQILEQGILGTFHLRSLVIAAVNHEEAFVEVVRAYPISPTTPRAPVGWRFDLSHPDILCDVVRNGRTEVIDGWDPRYHERVVEADGRIIFRQRPGDFNKGSTSFFVPILARDRVIGVVCTASTQSDRRRVLGQFERMRPFFDQVGATLSNVSEIIERRRTAEALQVTNLRLEEALAELRATQEEITRQERLRALGQMASGIAHDFNNTLSLILGYTQMLLAGSIDPKDRKKVTRALQVIDMAARDAARGVGRLREFYRPREKGEAFLPVNLNEVVGQTTSLTQPRWMTQAQADGLAIHVETALGEVPPVLGNEAALREMLTNLIFNAVDAMPEGGTITIRTRAEGGRVLLEVSDTGTGMTEETRQRCLDPFFTTKGERGTGLGLAMVDGITRRHEGTIEVKSELGRGTSVTVRLPVSRE